MNSKTLTRRTFVAGTTALTAGCILGAEKKEKAKRKIKLGVVGCGGRGAWITNLFNKDGGYEIFAVADYFQKVADRCGDKFKVDQSRRFSGLSGYKKLLASGVEAAAFIVPPYFFPEHTAAAVEAGVHVYMAKPVAVDVPGCLAVKAAAVKATEKKKCFLVDYQIPTDPANIKVKEGIQAGGIGPIAQVHTRGICSGFPDPPATKTIESRLQKLIWCNDVAIGGDYIVNFDIHAIDGAVWAIDEMPIAASGLSRICRKDPHGDSRDVCSVVYEYNSGIVHNHFGQALKNNTSGDISCAIFGQQANAMITYSGKAYIRGGKKHCVGNVENLYPSGASRNIAAFHKNICEENHVNDTVPRAVNGAMACILGRDAAAGRRRMTMEELVKAGKTLKLDLKGLKD